MIVQSIDGGFYLNPHFATPLAVVEFNDDGQFLYRKGTVQWRTAVKELTKLGIVARNKPFLSNTALFSDKIIDGELVECSAFEIRLIKPIPTPHGYKAQVGLPFGPDDEVLTFKKERKKRVVLNPNSQFENE